MHTWIFEEQLYFITLGSFFYLFRYSEVLIWVAKIDFYLLIGYKCLYYFRFIKLKCYKTKNWLSLKLNNNFSFFLLKNINSNYQLFIIIYLSYQLSVNYSSYLVLDTTWTVKRYPSGVRLDKCQCFIHQVLRPNVLNALFCCSINKSYKKQNVFIKVKHHNLISLHDSLKTNR